MIDINQNIQSPFDIKISFNKLIEHYERLSKNENDFIAAKARRVLEVQQPCPILRDGFSDPVYFETYKNEIKLILQDSFSEVLTNNEIKTASLPFRDVVFNTSARFRSIIAEAGEGFELKMKNMAEDDIYIMACAVVLNTCYGFKLNFKRPILYEIPDAQGVMRYYKVAYNADFIEIIPSANAPKITEKDFNELIDNFNDIELWKTKFPPKSYLFKGFVISNMFDVTDDQSISNMKSTFIAENKTQRKENMGDFQSIFQSLFGIKDLQVGFSIYNKTEDSFDCVHEQGIQSFLLNNIEESPCKTVLCEATYKALINKNTSHSISDVDKYYEMSEGKVAQFRILKEQGIKSAIFAPISDENELLGILEIVSKTPKILNSVNANKLADVMPFILSAVKRSKREYENLIEAIIQQECTSIHPSVSWKFENAARQFLKDKQELGNNAVFSKISFENVYPLFGQIDVKGSSEVRNLATKRDLELQLTLVNSIIHDVLEEETLPIYAQLKFQIDSYRKLLKDDFKVDSEQQIANFLKQEIEPLFRFFMVKKEMYRATIEDYFSKIDPNLNVVYHYRKDFDKTIALINKNMASVLDEKQKDAQAMYPHYFERFKTDGVEHNMYIGEAITKEDSFNCIYLYNLRLWQLQVMCEMENEYYQNRHKYPVSLDVASMILVFNQPLTISFRMDEKQFDVDGTYNARYEVVKKRVDKAVIKGTEQRVTEKGKITIIYSQKEDEIEYLEYIKFLQHKKALNDDVEIVELEDLQGVTGVKAIRVGILYQQEENNKEFYTYDDLMKTIKA
ncbi:GAF domain-containing protein [Aestuariibaculum suncheonense]|uniref:GAF domain-containing protein n=1 Tax=Aestuariibaculum suncheonense TaxID=1028745 RepID=A0A8J6QP92_9FLAO|nr:GAF domain-containing protein [Aestuariibaculum suncheonense]MBD0834219.1 GAF domain-containing protein [Aestuariibaculum suncheonense]